MKKHTQPLILTMKSIISLILLRLAAGFMPSSLTSTKTLRTSTIQKEFNPYSRCNTRSCTSTYSQQVLRNKFDTALNSQADNGDFDLSAALFCGGLAFDAYSEPPANSSRWERGVSSTNL